MAMGRPIRVPYGLRPYILYDLDSTIAHTKHRHHYIDKIMAGEGTWEDYSMMATDDTAIPGTLRLGQITAQHYPNFILTARMIAAREITEEWLRRIGFPYKYLKMCEDEAEHHIEYKVSAVKQWRADGWEPILAVEDSPEVMDAFAAEGIKCLAVNPRYEDDKPDGYY